MSIQRNLRLILICNVVRKIYIEKKFNLLEKYYYNLKQATAN